MKHLLKYIGAVTIGILAFVSVAQASIYPVQVQSFTICPQGASIGDATVCVQSMTDINGNLLTMASFGSMGFGTIDPNNGAQEESIDFTGITQNANGTATLTGVNDVSLLYPYTLTGNLIKNHAGGATFVISNTSFFYYQMFAIKQNSENITGEWTVPDPTAPTDIANREFVLNTITGTSTIATDKLTPGAIAGTTISAGQLVYFASTTAQWGLVVSSNANTYSNAIVGIAQGGATVGNAIPGGVLTQGLDPNQTGLTSGSVYYASTTPGGIGTTLTGISIGQAKDATHLYVYPGVVGNGLSSAGNNTFTGTNNFTGTTNLATSTTNFGYQNANFIGKNVQLFTSTGTSTFSVPNGINQVAVTVVGAGANGGNASNSCSSNSDAANGGNAGGYVEGIVTVTGTSTIQVHVPNANASDWATFGTNGYYMYANDGGFNAQSAVASTTYVNGIISINGQSGGNRAKSGTTVALGGTGASTRYGQGGIGSSEGSANSTNGIGYGAAGGGGSCLNGTNTGDTGSAGTQGLVIIRW